MLGRFILSTTWKITRRSPGFVDAAVIREDRTDADEKKDEDGCRDVKGEGREGRVRMRVPVRVPSERAREIAGRIRRWCCVTRCTARRI